MELRQNRRRQIFTLVLAAAAALLLVCGFAAMGGFLLLVALVLAVKEMRPFRFRILPEGLDIKHRGISRTVPWSEIDAIVLEQPPASPGAMVSPRILLIPAAGSDLTSQLDAKHPLDGRSAREVLKIDRVVDSPDDIAAAFATVSGGRFADLRNAVGTGPVPASHDFTMVLRGYAPIEVDQLIGSAQTALEQGPEERAAIQTRLANPNIQVVLRGYDRGQVDAHLQRLATELAR
jgi:hypothetical protein